MTQESIQPFLDWISAHPTWSGFAVFLISLSESLAIVGLIVPGVVIMTAIGGMMGAGILPLWITLAWAILGAIAGDGISYWIGHHYHEKLRGFWPFKQFPKLLARGEIFFRQHGGKSIVFGRFVGPVRPMIPVIAGMMDMAPRRFLFFNILSAIAWAPLYSLPGILIGASLGSLSPEVASRAGILVLIFLFTLWVIYEFLLFLRSWISSIISRVLHSIWRAISRLSWLQSIIQTSQGTEQSQLGIALLFLLSIIGFAITTFDVWNSAGVAVWNEPVYQVLRALYSDKWITFVTFITNLGDPWVLLPAAGTIGIWLIWRQRYKAAACWIITIGAGFLIGHYFKIITMIPRPEGLIYSTDEFAYPSGHTLTATLTFGLAAVFIQHALSQKYRWIPWLIVLPLIFVIGISRIYLGVHWFTDILGSFLLGTSLVSLSTLIYRRIDVRPILIRAILAPGLLVIAITFGLYSSSFYPKMRQEMVRLWPTQLLLQNDWWMGKGSTNGLYRTGAFKHQATVFDIQWLGPLDKIYNVLEDAGWKEIPKLNFKTGVMLLANNPLPLAFPVMPKFHRDRLPVLTMAKIIDENSRLVLQLWQSDFITKKNKQPLWVGTLRLEEANHPLPLVTIYLEHSSNGDILKEVKNELRNNPAVRSHLVTFKSAHQIQALLLKTP